MHNSNKFKRVEGRTGGNFTPAPPLSSQNESLKSPPRFELKSNNFFHNI